ncbi:unnamed protein product [Ophioblennius macclurei]
MAFLTNLNVLLVLACVSHQLVLCSRRGRSLDGGRSGRHARSIPTPPVKGKLVTKAKEDCTWTAAGEDVWVLGVTCRKGSSSFSCEYEARLAVCPEFSSNRKLFWKQVTRSLKKQKRLCRDSESLVRTGLCRRAARDAHFRLRSEHKQKSARLQPATSCQSTNQRLAEEYCSDGWSSFCTFFFTLVKDDDC